MTAPDLGIFLSSCMDILGHQLVSASCCCTHSGQYQIAEVQYQMGDLLFTIIHTTTPRLAEIHWSNADMPLFIFCHFKTALFLLIYLRLAATNLLTLLGLIAKGSPLPQYKILVYLLTLAQQAGGGCTVKFSVDFITCF